MYSTSRYILNKTNRRTKLPNLFCQETLHVLGNSSVHHQEFSTVHSALVYVIKVWRQLSSTTRVSSILVMLESCHQTSMTYTSAECTVENSWWWAEELAEIYRVSWQNKFGKSVRLLVLLKEIRYDARSHERKTKHIYPVIRTCPIRSELCMKEENQLR